MLMSETVFPFSGPHIPCEAYEAYEAYEFNAFKVGRFKIEYLQHMPQIR